MVMVMLRFPQARLRLAAAPRCWAASLRAVLVLTALLAGRVSPLDAQVEDVRIDLPEPAKIELEGRKTLLPAPFLLPGEDGETSYARNLELQEELGRFVRRVLRRESELEVLTTPQLDYPTTDLAALVRDRDFWRAVGERTGADLILFGGLDLDMLARSGYRSEDYIGPDGRIARREVLVEKAGVAADVVLYVLDGRTGGLLYEENFRDFAGADDEERRSSGGEAGAMKANDLFRRLTAFEDQLIGLFAEHRLETARTLYGG